MNNLRTRLHHTIEFEIFDYGALLQQAGFRPIEYRILAAERCLQFLGARHRNVDTVFGGQSGSPITIQEQEVTKLPHDLVHCSLSGVPEGAVSILGFTPDICVPAGGGRFDCLEISTVESGLMDAVVDRMNSKLEKYIRLTAGPGAPVRSMNLLIVTPDRLYDLNGELPASRSTDLLRQAYTFGLRIVREYSESPGFREQNKFSGEELKDLSEVMRAVPESAGFFSTPHCNRDIPDHPAYFTLSSQSFRADYAGMDEFEQRMRSRKEQRAAGAGTIVHVPMVIPNPRTVMTSSAEEAIGEGLYHSLFNLCLASGLHQMPSKSYEVLRMVSEMENTKKPHRQPTDGPDMIWLPKASDHKLELAERGVLALKNKLTNEPSIAQIRNESKKDVNYDEDLSHLDYYLQSEMIEEEFSVLRETEADHCYDSKVFLNLKPLIEKMGTVSEIHALHFLDAMFREISYNLTRAPRDNQRGHQFLKRMIPGYDAFVVIRTTSPSSSDQAHIFYALYFRGVSLATGIFEDSHDLGNGWRFCRFLSTDQLRLSQMQNADLQMCFHWLSMLDEGGSPSTSEGDCISPETDLVALKQYARAFRTVMLIYLEDKQVTSSALQDFRYYYMELNTGFRTSIKRAEKIASKFPDMIRSRLLLHFIRSLIRIHKGLDEVRKPAVQVLAGAWADDEDDEVELIDEDEDEVADGDAARFQIMRGIQTPFGFCINNPADLVRAMYMGYLHNKNEGFKGHGVVKMLEKTLKMAQKFRSLPVGDDPAVYCSRDDVSPDDMLPFQHSAPCIKLAAHALKRKLCSRVGLGVEKWDSYATETILRYLIKSTLDELATTKASTLPFQDITVTDPKGDAIKLVGKKVKCLEAVLNHWDEFRDHRLAMNAVELIKNLNDHEGGAIQVTLFKKAQIGGTREIYVLTIRGRMLVKVYSDMYRSLCELHPSEVLTKPQAKSTFIAEHFTDRRKLSGKYTATYKCSLDESTWAQMFNLYSFEEMGRHVLPSIFQPFARSVLNAHKNKRLQLPRSLVKQFLDSPATELSSKAVNELKREFVGDKSPELLEAHHRTSFNNQIDMMQGILHYPSSFYHLLICEYQSMLITQWFKKQGLDCLVSFVVGSDDEADLISFRCDDRAMLVKVMGRFHNAFGRIKRTVDSLFGVETSDKKSSCTYADILEINSEFYFGNTCQRALSKFENNTLFIDPAESLHLSIASAYSKLRDLRTNGASGSLCSAASHLQLRCFIRYMGVGTMQWYEPGLYRRLTATHTTVSGYYLALNELKAGLVDASYVNWLAVMKSIPGAAHVVYYLCNYALPLTPDEFLNAKFTVFPKDKYKKMLQRLGLLGQKQSDMDEDLFRIMLTEPASLAECRMKIRYQTLTPGIARSLAFLNRTHVDRMTPYVAWSAMYSDGPDAQRHSLPSLIKRCTQIETDRELLTPRMLFPMAEQFAGIRALDDIKAVVGPPLSYRRLFPSYISPQYYTESSFRQMGRVLRQLWFQDVQKFSARQCLEHFDQLRVYMPWLQPTLDATVEAMPLKNLHELYAFISSAQQTPSSFSALTRGRPKRAHSSVQALLRNNVFSRRVVHLSDQSAVEDSSHLLTAGSMYAAQRIGDRLRAWKDILDNSSPERGDAKEALFQAYIADCKTMAESVPALFRSQAAGAREEDLVIKQVSFIAGLLDSQSLFNLTHNCVLYESVQTRKRAVFTGNYSYIEKRNGILARVQLTGRTTHVRCSHTKAEFERAFKLSPDSYEQNVVGLPRWTCTGILWLRGNLLLKVGDGYMDLPRTHSRDLHFSNPALGLPPLLEAWLAREDHLEDSTQGFLMDSFLDAGISGAASRCILRCAHFQSGRVANLRITERMETAPEQDVELPEDNIELLMMLADNFEAMDEEDALELFADFIEDAEDPLEHRAAGMEASSLESFISQLETNRVLLSVIRILGGMERMFRLLSGEAKQMLMWYKDLSTKDLE